MSLHDLHGRVKWSFILISFFLSRTALCFGQEPVIQSTVPAAIPPGATTTVQINGAGLAVAKALWTSFSCESVLAEGVEKNGDDPSRVTFKITVPPGIACGIHGIRVVTDKGVTPISFLVVDDLPTIASSGKNTSFSAAEAVSFPVAVDGSVPSLGRHFFKFTVQAGQALSIEVLARRIGSSLDPLIRLLDLKGREIAYNDDTVGLNGDASIFYKFQESGDYTLELRDIKYGPGSYRLRIGDFPIATVAYPLAVQRGTAANVTLAGYGVEGLVPLAVVLASDQPDEWLPISLKRAANGASGFSMVAVVSTPQFLELEPNNTPEQANRIEWGHDVNGRLEQVGDIDHFLFAAKAGQSMTFTGITRQQGSPTDLEFKILNKQGVEVAAAEDSGTNEGSLTFKFPADGDYMLVVKDLNHRGGSEHAYRIGVTTNPDQFSLASSLDTFNIPVGGSVLATVTAVRTGHTGPIELSVLKLPAGVTASPSVIGLGRNDAVLTLQASSDFAAGQSHGISIVGTARSGDTVVVIPAEIGGVLKARNNNMRWPPSSLKKDLVASSAPAPGFTWRIEPTEVGFVKGLSAQAKLIVTRASGFDELVAVTTVANSLPAGMSLVAKNIEKGQSESEITISANPPALLGDFTVGLSGTLKQGDKTVVQGLMLRLHLDPSMTITLEPATVKIAKGGDFILKAVVVRNPVFTGDLLITLQNLPVGVSATSATIAADQTSVEIKLTALNDAPATSASINTITAKGEGMVGTAKVEAISEVVPVTIE